MEWVFSLRQIPCSEEDLYSAAYTFIDNKRAVPASKTTLCNSSYRESRLYRYVRESRTFRNITTYSIYIRIQGDSAFNTQLFPEHSRRLHYIPLYENM